MAQIWKILTITFLTINTQEFRTIKLWIRIVDNRWIEKVRIFAVWKIKLRVK